MTNALIALDAKRALLDGLIDDASLFPPAELPMQAALTAHGRDRESAYAFVQGRFVVPASRLAELRSAKDAALQLRLSVILDPPPGRPVLRGAADRLPEVARSTGDPGVAVESIEVRLPASGEELAGLVDLVDALAAWDRSVSLWAEPPYAGGFAVPLERMLAALAEVRDRAPSVAVGAKLRTGGLAPGAIPSVDEVAAFVVAAQAAGVPWKATAGLHHPIRRAQPPPGTLPMHGFLNVFVAACALHAGAVDAERVAAIVAEEEPTAFDVDPARVGWRDVALGPDAVVAARTQAVSFGSCSFFEPVDDLRRLGLLA